MKHLIIALVLTLSASFSMACTNALARSPQSNEGKFTRQMKDAKGTPKTQLTRASGVTQST